MSAEFDLVSIGALLQLWIFTIATFESVCCFTLCCLRQRLNLVLSSVSMRLRLKRFVVFSYFLSKLKSLLNPGLISGFLVTNLTCVFLFILIRCLQDLFWSRVFCAFSYKKIFFSFLVPERGSHLIASV
ncbi:hypothetical protein SO802_017774 [Lithocarpus litseifolius]|uniref:Uncharacterized protein n=1 Tax=Lithocarpus litseifolius TaxID=425828 RepID=A0AAW2CKJ9_9ROSI